MAALVWHSVGLGIIEAWHRDDGSSARCVLRIEMGVWPQPFRITARWPGRDVATPIVLTLCHSDFDLSRAKDLAELLDGEYPAAVNDETTLQQLIDDHRQHQTQRARARRCQFVHVWPRGAAESAVCQCGRLTRGLARDRDVAVPA